MDGETWWKHAKGLKGLYGIKKRKKRCITIVIKNQPFSLFFLLYCNLVFKIILVKNNDNTIAYKG